MSGLAHEITTKKITSEEETFSGQSLLIFRRNGTGIDSQFEPFISVLKVMNAEVAQEVTDSSKAAKEIVDPIFSGCGGAGAMPYCVVSNETCGEIVQASNREVHLETKESLGIE